MTEPTGSLRDAASVLFNLPDYRVVAAVDVPGGGRQVVVEPVGDEAGCPGCGVLTGRVHQRRQQRLRDVPTGGSGLSVWVVRRRFRCAEVACPVATFVEATAQVPWRARSSTRLAEHAVQAVAVSGRAVSDVARSLGVSWSTVQVPLGAAAAALGRVGCRR